MQGECRLVIPDFLAEPVSYAREAALIATAMRRLSRKNNRSSGTALYALCGFWRFRVIQEFPMFDTFWSRATNEKGQRLLALLYIWRARSDSNARPPGS